jgi:hypothetical protein
MAWVDAPERVVHGPGLRQLCAAFAKKASVRLLQQGERLPRAVLLKLLIVSDVHRLSAWGLRVCHSVYP